MATENIDIVVRERGARIVRRRLEDIGDTATRATRGLRLLQNALFVLGGAGIVSALQRAVDTLTNFENRIRLVTDSTAELNAVQNELFALSNRTRSSFEGSAEVYTRTALSVRELGVSQREVLQFTESLNQAVILSGASAREANAALIQLGQGLASNRLSGDELRSVLEQLPFVADVIARQLGVTRGELRELGREGKITGDIILEAFRNAREEIADRFADTVPTIAQSFTVLNNSLLQTLDRLDDFTGASSSLARLIIGLANSLDFLVAGLLAAGAAFAAFRLISFTQSVFAAIAANRQLAASVASGNAVLLTAVEIERAKAASSLAAAQSSATNAAAKVREIQLGITQLTQNAALLRQQQASIVIDVQKRRARDALTGRFIAYNAAVAQNIRTNRALLLTERALATSRGQLTAATTAQTAAETALSAATARTAAANAAASTRLARLTRAFPGLASAIGLASRALTGLGALIVANPIGAIVAAIVAAVAALTFFSDRITVTADGVVTLRDVALATFQLIGEAIAPVTNLIGEQFQRGLNVALEAWRQFRSAVAEIMVAIGNIIRAILNGIIGLFVGGYNAVVAVWNQLPQAFERLGALAINGLLRIVDAGIEGIVQGVGDLLEFIGGAFEAVGLENPFSGLLDDFTVDLERFERDVPDAVGNIGQIAANEFLGAFERDFVGEAFNAILDRARQIANERLANLDAGGTGTSPPGSSGAAGGGGTSFADIVRDLTLQNELLRLNADERQRLEQIIRIEERLKRSLTATERELIENLLLENEQLQEAARILDEIQQPARDYERSLAAINRLLEEGRISQDQYNQSLRGARIAFLETQTDIASGFERGFLKAIESASDFATQSEQIVTRAFDGMADALADFVVTGKADFGSFIQDINRQIVRLVVSQAFNQLFGGATGGTGGGNIFAPLFQGIGSLIGLQRGGSFMVDSGTGPALTGNDNRLVAFRAQDGETVNVTPRGQSPQGTTQNVNVTFNIQTPDVQGFQRSQSQLAAQAARVIAQGQRNL